MKYARLTKEQLEAMEKEFINFLATQSITGDEWQKIKTETPEVAEQEIDVFSDIIWEGVLIKVNFLEHISNNQIMLFKISEVDMSLIAITIEDKAIDFTSPHGYKWLQSNLQNDAVNMFTSTKPVSEDRNKDIFALIMQGAVITKGELYTYFQDLLAK